MKLHPSEAAFLKDLAESRASWTRTASDSLVNADLAWSDHPEAWATLSSLLNTQKARMAFTTAVSELLSGLTHSALVTLDGGSALAEATLLTISDKDGHEFKDFLHEFWSEVDGDAA